MGSAWKAEAEFRRETERRRNIKTEKFGFRD